VLLARTRQPGQRAFPELGVLAGLRAQRAFAEPEELAGLRAQRAFAEPEELAGPQGKRVWAAVEVKAGAGARAQRAFAEPEELVGPQGKRVWAAVEVKAGAGARAQRAFAEPEELAGPQGKRVWAAVEVKAGAGARAQRAFAVLEGLVGPQVQRVWAALGVAAGAGPQTLGTWAGKLAGPQALRAWAGKPAGPRAPGVLAELGVLAESQRGWALVEPGAPAGSKAPRAVLAWPAWVKPVVPRLLAWLGARQVARLVRARAVRREQAVFHAPSSQVAKAQQSPQRRALAWQRLALSAGERPFEPPGSMERFSSAQGSSAAERMAAVSLEALVKHSAGR
jgi:hypothetical protein